LKNTGISDLMKIRPVGAKLFHADGQTGGKTDSWTDMTKLIGGFRNFANTPGNSAFCPQSSFMCCNGSQNKQRLLSPTAFELLLWSREKVFTAPYEQNLQT
jgi:hypothetical protein